MLLMIDNYDSFTFNLVDYFKQLGQEITVIRNNTIPNSIDWGKYSGVILSPGPGKPDEANYLLAYLSVIPERTPILGICLGHQAIGMHYGAKLDAALKPMHGKLSTIEHDKHPLFQDLPKKYDVIRYHSLVINNLPDTLETICHTEENEVMAIHHKSKPISGIQFHPESVLTEYGMKLLENWLILNNIQC